MAVSCRIGDKVMAKSGSPATRCWARPQAYLMLDNPNAAVMRDSAVSDAATRILSAGALRWVVHLTTLAHSDETAAGRVCGND